MRWRPLVPVHWTSTKLLIWNLSTAIILLEVYCRDLSKLFLIEVLTCNASASCIHQNTNVSSSSGCCSEHFESLFFATVTQWQDKRAAAPSSAKTTGFHWVHNECINERLARVFLCSASLCRTCLKKSLSAQLRFLVVYSLSPNWSAPP